MHEDQAPKVRFLDRVVIASQTVGPFKTRHLFGAAFVALILYGFYYEGVIRPRRQMERICDSVRAMDDDCGDQDDNCQLSQRTAFKAMLRACGGAEQFPPPDEEP